MVGHRRLHGRVVDRRAGVHERRDPGVDVGTLGHDRLLPVGVPAGDLPLRVRGGVAPALTRLGGVRVVAEPLEQLLGCHLLTSLPFLDGASDGRGQRAQPS